MITNKKFAVTLAIIFVFGMSYGIGIAIFHIFPYDVLKDFRINYLYEPKISDFNPPIYEENIQDLIHISNANDLVETRNSLINYIWKLNEIPRSHLPTNITKNYVDKRYDGLTNLSSIELIEINMNKGVNSIAYHFIPIQSNNKLIIYHQGHDGDFYLGKNTIQFYLEQGYSVLALSMPLLGMNNQPIVETNFGKMKLLNHKYLEFLETDNFSPMIYFFEPINVSLNYLDDEFHYDTYEAIGISGGGWTVTLYAALDTRIHKTFSVAGTVPFFMRTVEYNLGDYEQIDSEFYRIAEYMDIYILASNGDNRKYIQVFNKFDPCCYSGDEFDTYKSIIQTKVQNLGGGHFDIMIDNNTHKHEISHQSLTRIMSES